MRTVLLAICFYVTAIEASAAEKIFAVTLPKYVSWCTPIKLGVKESEREENHEKVRSEAIKLMDKELEKQRERFSGIPYISNSRKISVGAAPDVAVDTITYDICYIVNSSISAPQDEAIKMITNDQEKVVALVCPKVMEFSCVNKLQESLATTLPGIKLDEIKTWTWRYIATIEPPLTTGDLEMAITTYAARPLFGDAQVFVYGNVDRPDPKKMRPVMTKPTGIVNVVPLRQGNWYVAVVRQP